MTMRCLVLAWGDPRGAKVSADHGKRVLEALGTLDAEIDKSQPAAMSGQCG